MLYVAHDDRDPVLPLPSYSWDYKYACREGPDGFQFSQTGLTLCTRLAWNSIFLRAQVTGTWHHTRLQASLGFLPRLTYCPPPPPVPFLPVFLRHFVQCLLGPITETQENTVLVCCPYQDLPLAL